MIYDLSKYINTVFASSARGILLKNNLRNDLNITRTNQCSLYFNTEHVHHTNVHVNETLLLHPCKYFTTFFGA